MSCNITRRNHCSIKAVSSSIWSSPFLGMVNVHIFVWKGEIWSKPPRSKEENTHKGFRIFRSQMKQITSFFLGGFHVFLNGWSKVYSISHKVLADALIAAQRHTGPTCGTWILVVLKHLVIVYILPVVNHHKKQHLLQWAYDHVLCFKGMFGYEWV